ncbi:uncharacterized protein SOCEGT47_030690 [Sorangium cellulosum]|uniref:Uncharacterized protein n=1 Tax=Sorangium cellulosum TaxID=56 RepID=A0A4P2Q060_SORCE|nr:uncharacterized protein SOCEGT47_030690 [Sorangium cellulosum]
MLASGPATSFDSVSVFPQNEQELGTAVLVASAIPP